MDFLALVYDTVLATHWQFFEVILTFGFVFRWIMQSMSLFNQSNNFYYLLFINLLGLLVVSKRYVLNFIIALNFVNLCSIPTNNRLLFFTRRPYSQVINWSFVNSSLKRRVIFVFTNTASWWQFFLTFCRNVDCIFVVCFRSELFCRERRMSENV